MTEAIAKTSTFSIPLAELADFNRLDKATRDFIHDHLSIFAAFSNAKSIKKEALLQSERYAHRCRGYSAKALMDKFRRYRRAGSSWQAIVPTWGHRDKRLPLKFIDFWRGLCGENKRPLDGTKGAYRRLIYEYYRAAEVIPGYDKDWRGIWTDEHPQIEAPKQCPTHEKDFPRGWSYRNLMRYQPSKAQLALMRTGRRAAHAHQMSLLRDRSKLKPFQYIAIDDFWIDQEIIFMGTSKPQVCRAIGILALDVATGRDLAFFLKPRLTREDGTREGINRDEVRELLLMLFDMHGVPADYPVTLIVENAAAAISPDVEESLRHATGGHVKISRTGIVHDNLLPHGFKEKGGKPWEKGWVESFFRLVHTTAGHLPGQTGSRYENLPGDTAMTVHYAKQLIKRAGADVYTLSRLQMPLLKFEEAQAAYNELLTLISCRTDHQLQGFEKITRWRSSPGEDWRQVEELKRLPTAVARSAEIIEERESPSARFTRLLSQVRMVQLPPEALLPLYDDPRPARIRSGRIVIQDRNLSIDPITFWQEKHELLERYSGESFDAHVARDLSAVHLTKRGRYLGSVERYTAPSLDDPAALGRLSGQVKNQRERDVSAIREHLAPHDEKLKSMREHNEEVFNEHSLDDLAETVSEPTPVIKKKKYQGTLDDLL